MPQSVLLIIIQFVDMTQNQVLEEHFQTVVDLASMNVNKERNSVQSSMENVLGREDKDVLIEKAR